MTHARLPAQHSQERTWRAAGIATLVAAVLWAAAGLVAAGPALASAGDPGQMCRSAVARAEAGSTLPPHLLAGIARVESGRRDPTTGRFGPWPWSINAEGRDDVFDTKAEAVAFAQALQDRGVRSFDVGCLQVNLMYHPAAFASLEDAFDPLINARYAVTFLSELRRQTGSWETASAWYHSATPEEGVPYRSAVVTAMAAEANTPVEQASLWSPLTVPGSFSMLGGAAAMAGAVPHSLPARPGIILLRSVSGGAGMTFPARAYASLSTPRAGSIPSSAVVMTAATSAMAVSGRGLNAYRLRPVAVMAFRMVETPRFR